MRVAGMLPGGLAAILMAWGIASHAAPLQRGDLLVTDPFGARVLRVDSAGGVEAFSPPQGGANILEFPLGITVIDDGPVFVVDQAAGLIEIDRTTGIQRLAQDSSGLGPVDVGEQPLGIDHFVRPIGLALYVTSLTGLKLVAPNLVFGGYDSALLSGVVPTFTGGVGVRLDAAGLDVEEVWLGTFTEGMWSWRAGVGAEQVLPPEPLPEGGERFSDVEFTHADPRVPVFTKFARPVAPTSGCVPGSGGVYTSLLGVGPISEGGLLRCPLALALVPGRAEIFVADSGIGFIGGLRDVRIVRLTSSGAGTWTQSIFVDVATLDVEFPGGIAFVPEPADGGLAAAALATLGLLASQRSKKHPGRISRLRRQLGPEDHELRAARRLPGVLTAVPIALGVASHAAPPKRSDLGSRRAVRRTIRGEGTCAG